jgi:Lrp/AsnC family leucine-responsive transcriptional regulator
MTDEIDEFDRKILAILQQDNHTRQRDIGERICLSAAAVHRRIRRMEDEGIIVRNCAVVSPHRIGRPTTVIVEVSVESERMELLDKMKESFAGATEIQQCYYVTGEADFVLVLTVADMKEYEALSRDLFLSNMNVRKFKTLVVMDSVKATLNVPVT